MMHWKSGVLLICCNFFFWRLLNSLVKAQNDEMWWKSQTSTLRTTNEHHSLAFCLHLSLLWTVKWSRCEEWVTSWRWPAALCAATSPVKGNFEGARLLHTSSPFQKRCQTWILSERPLSCQAEISSRSRESEFSHKLLSAPLMTGQGWDKGLAGVLPAAHCYPAHEGSRCCASSLSLTTSVNKDLNNKQRHTSLCVTVSFTGLSLNPTPATLMTLSRGARNGRLISFLWHH